MKVFYDWLRGLPAGYRVVAAVILGLFGWFVAIPAIGAGLKFLLEATIVYVIPFICPLLFVFLILNAVSKPLGKAMVAVARLAFNALGEVILALCGQESKDKKKKDGEKKKDGDKDPDDDDDT